MARSFWQPPSPTRVTDENLHNFHNLSSRYLHIRILEYSSGKLSLTRLYIPRSGKDLS